MTYCQLLVRKVIPMPLHKQHHDSLSRCIVHTLNQKDEKYYYSVNIT